MIDKQRKFTTKQKKYSSSLIDVTEEWRYKTIILNESYYKCVLHKMLQNVYLPRKMLFQVQHTGKLL